MGENMITCNLFINGREKEPSSGKYFTRENPATEKELFSIAEADRNDVDAAVRAARDAFVKWSATSPSERSAVITRIAEILQENADEIAKINTLETGKPLRESKFVEIGGSAATLRYYSGSLQALNGDTIRISDSQLSLTIKEPVGVAAQIIPWNFPLLLSFWKIAPALLAGCTIVLKPAELTSAGIVHVARLMTEAGLPDGVFNVVTGPGSLTGQALAEHPGIDKIAFTGSTEVGKIIMRTASSHIKRVSLELGGKAPCIVFDDADIDNAVEACLRGGFFNQGENCTAVTRLLLHKKIYDRFLEKYISRIEKIRTGDPLDENTEMGALISRDHYENVMKYIEAAVEQGGNVLTGNARPDGMEKGYFIRPTVIDNVSNKDTVACEEIFGPVVAVIPFTTEQEAADISNDTIYGLAGGIWTSDINRAMRVAKNIKAGYLWINTYGGIIPQTPYGGFKQSGIGKELGPDGLENYLEKKTVNIYTGDSIPKWYSG